MNSIASNSWNWGRPYVKREVSDMLGFPLYVVLALTVLPPIYLVYKTSSFFSLFFLWVLIPVLTIALFFASWIGFMWLLSRQNDPAEGVALDVDSYLTIKDAKLKAEFAGKRLPIDELYEAYFASKVDFKGMCLDRMKFSHRVSSFKSTSLFHMFDFCP